MIGRRWAGAWVLVFALNAASCTKESNLETENVREKAHKILDTQFHFLLKLADYEPERLDHGSDMFSAWGELELARKTGQRQAVATVRDRILRAAKAAGWKPAKELPDVESPDLEKYGISAQKEDLAIAKTAGTPGQNPPTRYGCRIWITPDGEHVVVSYRVDGE